VASDDPDRDVSNGDLVVVVADSVAASERLMRFALGVRRKMLGEGAFGVGKQLYLGSVHLTCYDE
jgi:hypothetical protein